MSYEQPTSSTIFNPSSWPFLATDSSQFLNLGVSGDAKVGDDLTTLDLFVNKQANFRRQPFIDEEVAAADLSANQLVTRNNLTGVLSTSTNTFPTNYIYSRHRGNSFNLNPLHLAPNWVEVGFTNLMETRVQTFIFHAQVSLTNTLVNGNESGVYFFRQFSYWVTLTKSADNTPQFSRMVLYKISDGNDINNNNQPDTFGMYDNWYDARHFYPRPVLANGVLRFRWGYANDATNIVQNWTTIPFQNSTSFLSNYTVAIQLQSGSARQSISSTARNNASVFQPSTFENTRNSSAGAAYFIL